MLCIQQVGGQAHQEPFEIHCSMCSMAQEQLFISCWDL